MNAGSATYILATSKPWPITAFMARRSTLSGHWAVCTSPSDLPTMIDTLAPKCTFFPHWSDIVPETVLGATEAVCFHMTDLPYGRGGSPLQNLIARGHKETMLTALRMTSRLDEGPIYAKRPLSLHGSALEIYQRAADLALDLIEFIIDSAPAPEPQNGTPTIFRRRTADESRLPADADAEALYDHIRMLDAPGYPHAFVDHGHWRVTFTEAELNSDGVVACARFRRRTPDGEG